MRRRLIQLAVFLLLGAILNVAIAWACLHYVSLSTITSLQERILTGGNTPQFVISISTPGRAMLESFPIKEPTEFFEGMPNWLEADHIMPALLLSFDRWPTGWPASVRHTGDRLAAHEELRMELCGWPFPALMRSESVSFAEDLAHIDQGSYSGDHVSNMMLLIEHHKWALAEHDRSMKNGDVSTSTLRPVWPGFAINTIVFAAALLVVWLLFWLLFGGIRHLRWRARMALLGVTLVVGLISTIAIAWASAIWDPRAPESMGDPGVLWGGKLAEWDTNNPGYVDWNIAREDGLASVHCRAEWNDGDRPLGAFFGGVPSFPAEPLVPYWGSMLRPKPGTGGHPHEVVVHAHGWPMCALWWGHLDERNAGKSGDRSIGTIQGISLDPTYHSSPWGVRTRLDRALPLQPIWLGLVVDNVVCSTTWLALFCIVIQLTIGRRHRREKRWLCPFCCYPIGVSSVCTECGKPVIPSSVEPKA